MMNCTRDKNKWLVHGTLTGRRRGRMWSRWFPRIRLAVDNRKSWILDFEATVLVDDLNIGWAVEVEGFATDNAHVLEVEDAGD